jgi:DNA segregation ATPase FtsK/SpoIIIE-like protein
MDLLKKHVNFLTLIEIGYKVVNEASVDADFVANAANISYNMAIKYIDALVSSKVIGSPDEDGKCAVLLTVAGFEDKIKSSSLTLGEAGEEHELDFYTIFPEAKGAGTSKKPAAPMPDHKINDSDDHEEEHGILNDPCFLEAVDVALTQGQISTALLQRRLSIGFGKAARYIDAMEAMGIVSEKCGAKPRVVLLTREEWVMKLSRTEL